MATVTVTLDPVIGVYELEFTANRDFHKIKDCIAYIKTMVPASDRMYDPQTKIWTIDEKWWVAAMFEAIFEAQGVTIYYNKAKIPIPVVDYSYENFYHNHTETPQVESRESIAAKLQTLLGVDLTTSSFDEIKRAYRQLARKLHPDFTGGDGAKMSELNSIWSVYIQN